MQTRKIALVTASVLFIGSAGAQQSDTSAPVTAPPVAVTGESGTDPSFGTATPESGGMFVPMRTLGPFSEAPSNSIPYTVNSVPQILITDQMAKDYGDILRNVPGVVLTTSTYSSHNSILQIRGFNSDYLQSFKVNGLATEDEAAVPVEALERVDAYEGLEGSLYGYAPPGGAINYTTKQPLDQPLTRLTLDYTSRTTFEESIDTSRRFGSDDAFGVRLNVAEENGRGAIDHYHTDRTIVALSADWKPSADFTAWTFVNYNSIKHTGQQPSFYIGGESGALPLPAPPDPTKNYGQPWFFQSDQTSILQAGLKWDPEHWTFRTAAGRVLINGNQQNGGAGSGSFDPDLTTYSLSSSFFSGLHQVVDSFNASASYDETWKDLDNHVTLETNGMDYYEHLFLPGVGGSVAITSSFVNPIYIPNPYLVGATGFELDVRNRFVSTTALDSLKYEWITLTGGLSKGNYRLDEQVGTFLTIHSSDNRTTPLASLSISPVSWAALYVSYIEGLQPGGPVGDTNARNFGSILPSYVSKQYEVGAKISPTQAFNFTLATFRTAQPAQFNEFNPDGTYSVTQRGQDIVRGAQLTFAGKVIPSLSIYGGATVISSRLHNTGDPASEGQFALNTPHSTANLSLSWDVPHVEGLDMLVSGYYTSSTKLTYDLLNLPAYETFDMGGKYSFQMLGRNTVTRLYVKNVAEKRYWGPGLQLGDPREIRASIQSDF